jgi:hypothetical protein
MNPDLHCILNKCRPWGHAPLHERYRVEIYTTTRAIHQGIPEVEIRDDKTFVDLPEELKMEQGREQRPDLALKQNGRYPMEKPKISSTMLKWRQHGIEMMLMATR